MANFAPNDLCARRKEGGDNVNGNGEMILSRTQIIIPGTVLCWPFVFRPK